MQVFFFFFFFSVCILVRQTEDGTLQLHCYLLWSPLFCLSLWSPLRPCHVFGQCFCDLHANNNTSILLCVYVKFHSVFSLRLNYDKSLCPLRLRGCCSWCRSALLRKLKEKNERGDWESSRVKVKYCDIWDEAGEGVCLDMFSQSNGWKWVFRCCLAFVLQCSRNANNDHKFLGLRLHFYAVLPSPESFSKACCPPHHHHHHHHPHYPFLQLSGLNFPVVSPDCVSWFAEVEQINPDISPPDLGSCMELAQTGIFQFHQAVYSQRRWQWQMALIQIAMHCAGPCKR